MIVMTASPVFTFTSGTSETVNSYRTASDSLVATLPHMFKTKLDCLRDEGCLINVVKSLSGGSICKGKMLLEAYIYLSLRNELAGESVDDRKC